MKERLNELLGPEFWEEFGRRLGKAIDESPHKPAHIAKHLHCSPAHISKAVSSGSISLQALTAIAIFLNKSLDEMVFGNKSRLPTAGQKFAGEVKDWLAKAPPGLLPEPVLEAVQEPPPIKAEPEPSPEVAEIGEAELKGARAGRKVHGLVEGRPEPRKYEPIKRR